MFIATAPAGTRTLGSQDVAAYLRALAMPPALADTLTGHDWVHEMLEYITSILRCVLMALARPKRPPMG